MQSCMHKCISIQAAAIWVWRHVAPGIFVEIRLLWVQQMLGNFVWWYVATKELVVDFL